MDAQWDAGYSAGFSIAASAEDCFSYCKDCDAQDPTATDMTEARRRSDNAVLHVSSPGRRGEAAQPAYRPAARRSPSERNAKK